MFKRLLTVLFAGCAFSQRITRDKRCGVSLGCFDSCVASNLSCTYAITWTTEGNNIRFRFIGHTLGSSYIALGFSKDEYMNDDGVIECVTFNGIVKVFESYNHGKNNTRLSQAGGGISNVSTSVRDGVFECSFLRRTKGTSESHSVDLNNHWYLLVAHGHSDASFGKIKHSAKPAFSSLVIDLHTPVIVVPGPVRFPMIKAHGALMVFAWMLTGSIGIVIARWYKSMWPNRAPESGKVWFKVHRVCMMATTATTYTGLIVVFVDTKDYSKILGYPYQRSHPVIGILVIVFLTVNYGMAMFRPVPNSDRRSIYNWTHFLLGRTMFILANITTYFGITLIKAQAPFYLQYVVAVFTAWHLLVEVILEVLDKCTTKPEDKYHTDLAIELASQHKPNFANLKVGILAVHVCVVLVTSIAVVGILVAS